MQALNGYLLCMKPEQGSGKTRDGATGSESSGHQVSSYGMVEKGAKRANGTRGEVQGQKVTPTDLIVNYV